ncbi:MAG TPA: thioredoxin [Ktedonobacteraceae bacterium]|nr:thioredoxin [Ktedonobacteraceae bacterium]
MHEQMLKQDNLFDVGDQDFEEKVFKSDLPVIVDFWAEWCPHCHNIAPIYKKLSEEYQGKLRFAKLNTDEHQDIPAHLGVQGLPTFLMFNNGRIIGRLIGPHPSRLKQNIDRVLAENSTQ